jgi:hypothetical protein
MCRYNLRGLVEPRCPECGYQFQWAELRDPSKRLHPYLFEHHPERNVWSFLRTVGGLLLPTRFWRQLLPVQPSRPRRLFLYWLVIGAILLLAWLVAEGAYGLATLREYALGRARAAAFIQGPQGAQWRKRLSDEGKTLQQFLQEAYPTPGYAALNTIARLHAPMKSIEAAARFWLLWPLTTILVMKILRVSMRRAKVRHVHIARCVVYNSDILIWFASAILLTVAIDISSSGPTAAAFNSSKVLSLLVPAWPAMFILLVWRMIAAYRKYLRFPHAIATVLLTQILVALLVLIEFGVMFNLEKLIGLQ